MNNIHIYNFCSWHKVLPNRSNRRCCKSGTWGKGVTPVVSLDKCSSCPAECRAGGGGPGPGRFRKQGDKGKRWKNWEVLGGAPQRCRESASQSVGSKERWRGVKRKGHREQRSTIPRYWGRLPNGGGKSIGQTQLLLAPEALHVGFSSATHIVSCLQDPHTLSTNGLPSACFSATLLELIQHILCKRLRETK